MAEVKILKLVAGVWAMVDGAADDITVKKMTAATIDVGGADIAALAPTSDEKAALAGTDGNPAGGNKYVTDSDSRNTNDRGAVSHVFAGARHSADTLANLNTLVSDATLVDTTDSRFSDARTPTAHTLGSHTADTLANLNAKVSDATLVDTGDARFTDDRNPHGHEASHQYNGSDSIATNVPATNSIPRSGGGGNELDAGWIPAGGDGTAIHRTISGEINQLSEKVAPDHDDLVIVEDSANGNAKMKVKLGNLGGGGGSDAFYAIKPSQTVRNNTNTPAIDPHLFVDDVENGTYIFQARLIRAGLAAADQKVQWLVDDGGVATGNYTMDLDSQQGAFINLGTVQTPSTTGESSFNSIHFQGFIQVTTPGRFSLKWSQQTQGVSDSKMDTGSWFSLVKAG